MMVFLLALVSDVVADAGSIADSTHRASEPVTPAVAAMGRIEPRDGIVRLSGPPRPAVVIRELLVQAGDRVARDQLIAVLAGIEIQRAELERITAVLKDAENELGRNKNLREQGSISDSAWSAALLARDVAAAERSRAAAELALSEVRSPRAGTILEIHSRAGERVGADGILELADTSTMYAVAEVYETDIGRVHLGQTAWIRSPALSQNVTGVVDRIGLKVGKKDTLSTDPVADADARVVEVWVQLRDSSKVAGLTNLRVEVMFNP